MTLLNNNHRLVTVICPSCNGNGCGICGHIGKCNAKEYAIIEPIEPLRFKSNKGDFDFEPEELDDQELELHYMELRYKHHPDEIVFAQTISNPSEETKKRFCWRAKLVFLKIKIQKFIEKIKNY